MPTVVSKDVPAALLKKAPWLAKVPVPTKTGNPNVDEDNMINYRGMCKCFVMLSESQKDSLPCVQWLERRSDSRAAAATAGGEDKDLFPIAPGKLSNVDISFCASYWKANGIGLTEEELGLWKSKDAEGFRLAFCGWLNLSPALKLSPACQNKIVLKKALDMRHIENDERFDEMFEDDIQLPATGVPDWGRWGIYAGQFEDETDLLVQVIHKPTGHMQPVDPDLKITKAWALRDNYAEAKAEFYLSQTHRHNLLTFWIKTEGNGPYAKPTLKGQSKVFDEYVAKAEKSVENAREQARNGQIEAVGSAWMTPQKAKTQESAKRAREQLKERNSRKKVMRSSSAASSAQAPGLGSHPPSPFPGPPDPVPPLFTHVTCSGVLAVRDDGAGMAAAAAAEDGGGAAAAAAAEPAAGIPTENDDVPEVVGTSCASLRT